MGGFLKDPQTGSHGISPFPAIPHPQDCPDSFLSQFLTCPGEERLNQAKDIIPCLLGAAAQFLIVEEGLDMFNSSPFSPFDHKLKKNLPGKLEKDKSSPACLRLCSLG